VQLNYHGRLPAKRQTTLVKQQLQSNDLVNNRTVAALEDQRTLNSPSAGKQREATRRSSSFDSTDRFEIGLVIEDTR